MSFVEMLGVLSSISVGIERVTEVIKPIYLEIKNEILKKDFAECSRLEKRIITIIIGIITCIFTRIGIDIPGVNEPLIVQAILAGFISSFGSNVLHTLLTILTGFKDATEAHALKK
jgi:hypothetical protein